MALNSGISPSVFWTMSIDEIVDVVDCYAKQKTQDIKMKIIMMEVQAQQIAEHLAGSKENKTTRLWDYYPQLFEKERLYVERQNEDEELEKLKMRRKRFANIHNRRVGGGS